MLRRCRTLGNRVFESFEILHGRKKAYPFPAQGKSGELLEWHLFHQNSQAFIEIEAAFDVADVVKDGILLPLAFESAKLGNDQSKHKKLCSDHLQLSDASVILFNSIKTAITL